MTTIYILFLEDKKYYVGRTQNFEQRKIQHINGTATSWTKKYKYISTERIIENSNIFDEDRYTKEYMSIYGIDNVRGGSYITIILDNNQKKLLQTEFWNASNVCIRCGRDSHFIKDCYAKVDINNVKLIDILPTPTITNTIINTLINIVNIPPDIPPKKKFIYYRKVKSKK